MIKLKLLSFFVFSFVAFNCFSQTFQRLIGMGSSASTYAVMPTTDSGYIVTGYANIVGVNDPDMYLVKTNGIGEVTWSRTYRDIKISAGYAVQQTFEGGYIIAGSTYVTDTTIDIYIVKTDANGDTLWTRTYGGAGNELANHIVQTYDSGYIVIGSTTSFGAGDYDIYLLKLDGAGGIEWTKTYGGSDYEDGADVRQAADSGFILCGTTSSFGAGNKDFYMIRTDAQGDTLWTKTYGGSAFEVSTSLGITFDGGYIITGYTSSFGVNSGGIYMVKTNADGDTTWTRKYDGDYFELAKQVQQTADSGYMIAGYTNSSDLGIRSAFILKTNAAGSPTWSKAYGGNGYEDFYSGKETPDGGYILAGSSASFGYQGGIYLVKTDENGNSGCNQGTTGFVAGQTTTIIKSTNTIGGTGGASMLANTTVGSGVKDSILCLVTGISGLSEMSGMTIYPNPAGNYIRVNVPENKFKAGNSKLYIVDALGKIISYSAFNPRSPVDISMLPAGIYMLHILDERQLWIGKLVKE